MRAEANRHLIGRQRLLMCIGVSVFAAVFWADLSAAQTQFPSNRRLTGQIHEKKRSMTFVDVMLERRRELLEQLMEHVQLTFLAMALATTAGVSTGVFLTRFRRLATPVLGVASVIQTIPSLALLALMIPLLGIGTKPAVAALLLYALLPIMRNTYTAIDEVDPTIIEVGKGMGMTDSQILWNVEIPLCVPLVMAGIRTSTVICVGIATLCTFIGAGGLGAMIMEGMQSRGSAPIFAGVIPAILLAVGLDSLCALSQRLLTPEGLKVSRMES